MARLNNISLKFGTIICIIGVAYVMSQFYRTANGVIAKELTQEFSLSPEELGILTGIFFVSFGLAQIPVGMLFDRFGVRRILPALLIFAFAGALVFAASNSFTWLLVGRFMMGLGVSGVLVGALFLFSHWIPPDRYATWLGRMIAIGGVGILLATSPLSLASENLGWRYAFVGAGIITAISAICIYLFISDKPPNEKPNKVIPETLRESLSGVLDVFKTKNLPTVMLMAFASYPVLTSILGLWGAPYLIDVYSLDGIESGNILLLMALCLILGNIVFGPLERALDTRKWLVIGCASIVTISFAVLALVQNLSLISVLLLFMIISFCSAYNIVITGYGRSLFPSRLAGRGVAMLAIALMGGPAIMQPITGLIMGSLSVDNRTPSLEGYQGVFGFLACVVFLAIVAYSRLPDLRPSQGFIKDD